MTGKVSPSMPPHQLLWWSKTLLLLACLLTLITLPADAEWPQLRGPQGRGHSRATGLPLTWSEDDVAWKVAIPGRGWSSPVILGGQIWMTTALEEERSLRAIAVDRESGEIVHDVEVFHPAAWQATHPQNSYASPTPVIEDGRVYVHFGTYGTACLATTDGRILWTRQDIPIDHEVGPGSSPILFQDLLIVNFDGTGERFVAAFHKHTGELAWKASRSVPLTGKKGTHRKAFSTPIVIHHRGQPQLVSPGAGQVSAYRPDNGKEIWRVRYDGYSVVPQPLVGLGMVFVDTGYVKPHLLAIRLGGEGDVTDSHVAWSYHWQVPADPSPVLVGDRIFMVSDGGIATWLDARKGEEIWRVRLKGDFQASPIHAHGRIYVVNVAGTTTVLAAGDEHRELAVNHLGATGGDTVVRATPAFAGHAIYLRSEHHLYRIGKLPD